jgi:hypothetical protein
LICLWPGDYHVDVNSRYQPKGCLNYVEIVGKKWR